MAEAADEAAAIVEIVATAVIAAIAGKGFLPSRSGGDQVPLHTCFFSVSAIGLRKLD
jgi:hypothetical protein